VSTAHPTRRAIDRTARIIASVAAGSLFGVVTTLLGFWATPLILRAIGSERYGLGRALTDVFAYLMLLEFGLVGASRALLAAELATEDPQRKATAFAITIRAYDRATLWKVLPALALIWASPSLLHLDKVSRLELVGAGATIALTTLGTRAGALQALLSTEQRDYSVNLTIGAQNVLITLFAVAFARVHWGIPGQMAAQVLGSLFLMLTFSILTRDALRQAKSVNPSVDRETNITFSRLNRVTFWRMLAGRIALLSDRVVVGMLLGGSAVTGYHSTVRLTDAVFPHLLGVGNASWPAMVEIHNRGQSELFAKRLTEVTTTTCGLGVMFVVPVLSINNLFVKLWLGPGLFGGWVLTTAASCNVILLALVSYWEWCFQCTQKIETILPVTAIAGIVNLLLSVAGTLLLGAPGPALGTAVATAAVVIPWEVHLMQRHFGVPVRALSLAIAKPLALGFPYILLCHWLAARWLPESWSAVACFAAASAGSWAILAWWTVFDADTRRVWRNRLNRLLPRAL
jgi:O-antigen/teichoic acid export membrane protein